MNIKLLPFLVFMLFASCTLENKFEESFLSTSEISTDLNYSLCGSKFGDCLAHAIVVPPCRNLPARNLRFSELIQIDTPPPNSVYLEGFYKGSKVSVPSDEEDDRVYLSTPKTEGRWLELTLAQHVFEGQEGDATSVVWYVEHSRDGIMKGECLGYPSDK